MFDREEGRPLSGQCGWSEGWVFEGKVNRCLVRAAWVEVPGAWRVLPGRPALCVAFLRCFGLVRCGWALSVARFLFMGQIPSGNDVFRCHWSSTVRGVGKGGHVQRHCVFLCLEDRR